MKTVFVDTNVILDVLLQNDGFQSIDIPVVTPEKFTP